MAITAARFIREHVLELSQTDLAQKLGVSQPAVAKYDRSGVFPPHHRKKIRALARQKKKDLPEEWFTTPPFGDSDAPPKT
jgi:predicted transcriptional regulator